MTGKFITSADAERTTLDYGTLTWLSRPQTTGSKNLVSMEAILSPGAGHFFHKHLEQDEVLYVIEGSIEEWLLEEKRVLNAGDSVFVPAGVVHASFVVSSSPAKVIVTLGPCSGPEGFDLVDVSGEAPWNALR